jgi:hypothetical protein
MTALEDTCVWCNHDLKVADRHWEKVKSHIAMPICANYCNDKTCKAENCKKDCGDVALSTPANEEKMLHEIVRRKRKLERLEEDAKKAMEAAANASS